MSPASKGLKLNVLRNNIYLMFPLHSEALASKSQKNRVCCLMDR